jgi:hypothetical protein
VLAEERIIDPAALWIAQHGVGALDTQEVLSGCVWFSVCGWFRVCVWFRGRVLWVLWCAVQVREGIRVPACGEKPPGLLHGGSIGVRAQPEEVIEILFPVGTRVEGVWCVEGVGMVLLRHGSTLGRASA